jgi:hypothetical protein
MNWFDFLTPDEGEDPNSARRSSDLPKEEPRDAEGHVRAFLPHLERILLDAAGTFNQSATDKVQVDVIRNREGVEGILLKFDGCGFAFEPTGKGAIQVKRLDGDGPTAHALLRPRLSRRGTLRSWREHPTSRGEAAIPRTADELCEHYFLQTVRCSLVSDSD